MKGMYYLRSRPAVDPIKFTVDVELLLKDAGDIEIKRLKKKSMMQLEEDKLNDKENEFSNNLKK
jgi:ribonucleoside-diphosphate reductase subunit M1